MPRSLKLLLLALALFPGALAAIACGGGGDEEVTTGAREVTEEPAAAGEAREIVMTVRDFAIDPSTIEVKAGETIRLVYTNKGEVEHDVHFEELAAKDVKIIQLSPGLSEEEREEIEEEIGMGEVEVAAAVGETSIIEFTVAAEPGTYEMVCPMEGHADKGMTGTLVVRS